MILALNGIATPLEPQHSADPALPQKDFANMKERKPRETKQKPSSLEGEMRSIMSLDPRLIFRRSVDGIWEISRFGA